MTMDRDIDNMDQAVKWLEGFGIDAKDVEYEEMTIDLGEINDQERLLIFAVWESGYTLLTPDFITVDSIPEMSLLGAINYLNSSIFGVKLIYNKSEKSVTSEVDVICGRMSRNKFAETFGTAVGQAEFAEDELMKRINQILEDM